MNRILIQENPASSRSKISLLFGQFFSKKNCIKMKKNAGGRGASPSWAPKSANVGYELWVLSGMSEVVSYVKAYWLDSQVSLTYTHISFVFFPSMNVFFIGALNFFSVFLRPGPNILPGNRRLQWWIQDFTDGEGAPTPKGGAPTYYLGNVLPKIAWTF